MADEHDNKATPSASIILARCADPDDGAGLEVLMVRRHRNMAFGSADAFPGGKLCDDDAHVSGYCGEIDAREANRRLCTRSSGLAYYSAAIRELFEETGVLLARPVTMADTSADAVLDQQRVALARGRLSWRRFLDERDLILETGELHYVSHWEAPFDFHPRFSTRFFVTVMPGNQPIRHDGRELVDSRWLSPAHALRLGRGGELNLPFPTIKNLEALADFGNLGELMQWARSRWQNSITKMRGVAVEEGGERRILLPGDPDYPEDEC